MYCTWVLSAPPAPTTAGVMWRGAYSLTGSPALTQAQIAAQASRALARGQRNR